MKPPGKAEEKVYLLIVSGVAVVGGLSILVTGHAGYRTGYASGPHIYAAGWAFLCLGAGYLISRMLNRRR